MTVGIVITNGLEAIAIADSRSSNKATQRESDSAKKMSSFSKPAYAGVIFGAGNGNHVDGIVKNAETNPAANIDELARLTQKAYKQMVDDEDISNIALSKSTIEKKATAIPDEKERQSFITNEINRLMSEYEKVSHEERSVFIAVAYDNEKQKVRIYGIKHSSNPELFIDHFEIGSGLDGANLYLGNKLQGVDCSKLSLPELAFFALNAYANATVTQGVGGTPKIAVIKKDGCEMLLDDKALALTNLSGAYLSGFNASALNHESTIKMLGDVLTNPNPNYGVVAQNLGLNEDALKTTYIPYSSWQERTNRDLFSKDK